MSNINAPYELAFNHSTTEVINNHGLVLKRVSDEVIRQGNLITKLIETTNNNADVVSHNAKVLNKTRQAVNGRALLAFAGFGFAFFMISALCTVSNENSRKIRELEAKLEEQKKEE